MKRSVALPSRSTLNEQQHSSSGDGVVMELALKSDSLLSMNNAETRHDISSYSNCSRALTD
jgi:hypothetical protein